MLWWFPLEPLDERYTECWSRWFPEEFNKHDFHWSFIKGDTLTKGIEEGEFLDIYSRPYYALSQIKKFVRLWKKGVVKPGDCLLFADLWHHGIESIPYIRDLGDKNLKIYGIFHAGSYDPYDFLSLKKTGFWARQFEDMVCASVNKIFVGSKWSKELLENNRLVLEDKIAVTGLPIKCEEIVLAIAKVMKSIYPKLVIFPHRIAPEKGVSEMIDIMSEVFEDSDDIKLVITSGRINPRCRDEKLNSKFEKFISNERVIMCTGLSKSNYYQTLAQCDVILSTAEQETFGYGTLEAVLCGCTPVVPDRLSYPDILQNDTRFFYNDIEEAVEKILKYCGNPINVSHYAKRYDLPNTIGRMLKEMDLV